MRWSCCSTSSREICFGACPGAMRGCEGPGPHDAHFAEQDCVVIERFGRFPARNAALGRTLTAEEEVYLTEHPDGF